MMTQYRGSLDAIAATIFVAERLHKWLRGFNSCVVAIILLIAMLSGAAAAPRNGDDQEVAPPPKLSELLILLADPKAHELLTVLADPKIQEWLEQQGQEKVSAGSLQGPNLPDEKKFGNRWGRFQPGQQARQGQPLFRGLTGPVLREDSLSSGAGAIHDQIIALISGIPNLPSEFKQAGGRIAAVQGKSRGTEILLKLAIFVAFGLGAEWLFRKLSGGARRRLNLHPTETVNDRLRLVAVRSGLAFGAIVAFVLGCLVPFFVLPWDPARRETLSNCLIAFVVIRVAIAVGRLLLAPDREQLRIVPMDSGAARFWCCRLVAFMGSLALLWLIVQECTAFGFSFDGIQLVGYTLGLGVLAIGLETVWRRPIVEPREISEATPAETRRLGRRTTGIALSIGLVLLWACWVAAPGVMSVDPAFWLILVIIALPLAISISRRAVEQFLRPTGSSQVGGLPTVIEVSLKHGIRAVLIIGAVSLLGWAWDVDLVHLTGRAHSRASRMAC